MSCVLFSFLGDTLTYTDRNGNTHTYSYDVLDRITADAVTTLGSGVDGSIRRITYAYDAQGNTSLITSYNAAPGGSIVNQVEDVYNGLGQLVIEYQANDGAVNTSTTPAVTYTYNEMYGGANNSRLVSMTYPSGYTLEYSYGTSGGLDDRISRFAWVMDTLQVLESYKYLGLDTVVERDHPQDDVNLTYISQTGSTGDAGDKYTGLDRFGRVVEQNWYDTTTGSSVDDLVYGYDRDSNVLYTVNEIDTAFSDLYAYNNLNELTSWEEGTLNSGHTAITGTPTASQSFSMDALGNFTSVVTNGTTQTRSANAQNEITSVPGDTTPTFDSNGNMTTDETGRQFAYDAWNRLVVGKNSSGTAIDTFSYDGLNRQIEETPAGSSTQHFYYSTGWQVLEVRIGSSTNTSIRYVWSPVYVDAMIYRDRDTTDDGTLDERLYALEDANYNAIGVVDTTGTVQERYVYTPYGVQSIYSASWTAESSSSVAWVYGWQGRPYDATVDKLNVRRRWVDVWLGRATSNDPAGFGAGQDDFYVWENDSPLNGLDPSGLSEIPNPFNFLNPTRDKIVERVALPRGGAAGGGAAAGFSLGLVLGFQAVRLGEAIGNAINTYNDIRELDREDAVRHRNVAAGPAQDAAVRRTLRRLQPVPENQWREKYSTQTGNCSRNAGKLRDNLALNDPRFEAHHIINSTNPHGNWPDLRKLLDRYNIDINSANNGVSLPRDRYVAEDVGIQAHRGNGLHSDDTSRRILQRMQDAIDGQQSWGEQRRAILEELRKLQNEIGTNQFPGNRRN